MQCGSFMRCSLAVFAALTTILAKIGVENVDSTLATAIRNRCGARDGMGHGLPAGKTGRRKRNRRQKLGIPLPCPDWRPAVRGCFTTRPCRWARPAVWLIDKLSVVITMILAFVVLHETVTVKGVIGGILIAAGTLFMIL